MNKHLIFKVSLKIASVIAGCGAVLAVTFSLWYVIKFYPRAGESFEVNSPDLNTRILVAAQGSTFKNGLVSAVCDRLRDRPVYVRGIDVGGLRTIDPADWDKVLVINTAMINIMSRPVRRLVSRGEGLENVLLFITSGGADFKPADLEVDALSGASRTVDTEKLAGLILDWIDADAEGVWTAEDQVLALEYFLQVDVETACQAITSDRSRYESLYPNLEIRLNRVGYDLLRRGLVSDALLAFGLNRDLFPESWNVYDSYADALLADGDLQEAIANCRRSVELNPEREAGRQRLAELQSGI